MAAEEHAFLLHVAVLGRFTAELCDAVLGRRDSAAMLDELGGLEHVCRTARAPVTRVHPLFAQFATARLVAADPGAAVPGPPAADGSGVMGWSSRQSSTLRRLVTTLITAGLERVAFALLRKGRAATLLRWTQTLPTDALF